MGFARPQGAYTQDEQYANLGNPFDAAHTISTDRAIDPHAPGKYMIIKATAAALTLGAPVPGLEDGLAITIYSATAAAHVLTATGLLQTASAFVNTATMTTAGAGSHIILMAFSGKWICDTGNGITFG
jgi:hypothetical protein